MPITLPCPNPACGRSACVAEDSLGRLARCKHCGFLFTLSPSSDDSPPAAVPAASPPLTIVDRFEIREKLGRGAFGTVYRAFDPRHDREIALKVLNPEAFASARVVERFRREAQAMARLHHPHIVPLYEAGQSGTHHFIASALIRGRTLASAIPEGGMDSQRAVRLTVQLSEALAAAHKQGVLHRDVKPSNIMLEEDALYLMDFGLAGWTEQADSRMTKVGALLGTPAYMAPEQARGDVTQVGPPADLYSAGVVLYEMLTGRAPFEGHTAAIVYNVVHTAPPPPSEFRPGLDADLEALCLKALAKRPEDRFPGGQEMAVALHAWLARAGTAPLKVTAPPPPPRPQAVMPTMRGGDPRDTSLGEGRKTIFPSVADKPAPTSIRKDVTVDAPSRRAGRQARAGGKEEKRGHSSLPTTAVGSRRRRELAMTGAAVLVLLATLLGIASLPSWRTPLVLSLKGHTGTVFSVAYSPDGKHIVSGGRETTVKVWDAATGQEALSLQGHTSIVVSVAYSPDGKRIATGSADNTVKVWDAATGQEVLSLKGHTNQVRSVAYRPDSKRIVSSSLDADWTPGRAGDVKVWDTATGQEVLSLKGHTNGVSSVAYSPDGERIVSGSDDNTVKVWDAATGQEVLSLKGHTDRGNSVAYSPDGERIASGSADNTVKVWDAATGQEILFLKGHTSYVTSVAYSPDGNRIISGSWDKTVKVWDAHTGQ